MRAHPLGSQQLIKTVESNPAHNLWHTCALLKKRQWICILKKKRNLGEETKESGKIKYDAIHNYRPSYYKVWGLC